MFDIAKGRNFSAKPPRVLPLGPPLKIFTDYDKRFLGAAPPRVTRGVGFETEVR